MTTEEFDDFYSNIKITKCLTINSRYHCLITDCDIDSIEWIINDAVKTSRSKHLNVLVRDLENDEHSILAHCILTNNTDLVNNQKYSIALSIDDHLINTTLLTYGVAD